MVRVAGPGVPGWRRMLGVGLALGEGIRSGCWLWSWDFAPGSGVVVALVEQGDRWSSVAADASGDCG